MMEVINKLTPDQRRFALYGSASLLIVGIILFLIYGLQGVSFGNKYKDENAEQYIAMRDAAAQSTYQDQQRALALQEAVATQFPEVADTLAPVISTSRAHIDLMTQTMEEYDIEVPEVNIDAFDTFDSVADGCAEALQFELEHNDDLQGQYAQDAFVWGEVRSAFLTIAGESDSEQVPVLRACAQ